MKLILFFLVKIINLFDRERIKYIFDRERKQERVDLCGWKLRVSHETPRDPIFLIC